MPCGVKNLMKSAVPTGTTEVSSHIQIAVDEDRRGKLSYPIIDFKLHPARSDWGNWKSNLTEIHKCQISPWHDKMPTFRRRFHSLLLQSIKPTKADMQLVLALLQYGNLRAPGRLHKSWQQYLSLLSEGSSSHLTTFACT